MSIQEGVLPESFEAITPGGRIKVRGEFSTRNEEVLCRGEVILDGNDKTPLDEIETTDSNTFLKWMREQMIQAMRRDSGQEKRN